jgi:hypothetical protein
MSGPASAPATFYRPAEVAAMLRCSEWWVKEQARRRRIPYSWIGGSYLFTDEHIVEIVRLFEVRPTTDAVAGESAVIPNGRTTRRINDGNRPAIQLVARTPRRARAAGANADSAAA